MHPVLAKIGPFTVYSYGVMLALAFTVALYLILRRAPKFAVSQNDVLDLAILLLVSGIIGGRALYVLMNFSYYAANPFEIPNLTKGGLVWYGGLAAAVAAFFGFCAKKKLNARSLADLIAPYLALGQAVGRIGCFLNGCCYGTFIAPGLRHPAQIYSSVSLLLLFAVLRALQDRRRFDGEVFLGYLALYSAMRFLVEFVRGDNARIFLGMTVSQIIGIPVFILSSLLLINGVLRCRKSNSSGSR